MSSILNSRETDIFRKYGTEIKKDPGQNIYCEGDPADKVYYIISGRVRVYFSTPSGRETTLDVVEAGHIFGESAFEGESTRPANVDAVNTVKLISCDAKVLKNVFRDDPGFAFKLLDLCSETMNRLSTRLIDQCMFDRFGKTASFILDITATDSKDKGTEGGRIPYTHEELATALGLNRSTVTLILKKFTELGFIEKHYRFFKLKDRKGLEEFVEEQKNN